MANRRDSHIYERKTLVFNNFTGGLYAILKLYLNKVNTVCHLT